MPTPLPHPQIPSHSEPPLPAQDLVIYTEHLAQPAVDFLVQHCTLVHCPHDHPDFPALLSRASALIVRTYTIVNQSLLDRAPNLRVVARAGVGLDNIDLPACRNRGIHVVFTPDANTQAVVEYVFNLISSAIRPLSPITGPLSPAHWSALRSSPPVRQLNQLTLGILGLGRIGRRLARALNALTVPVIYHDLLDIPPTHRSSASLVDLHTLFKQSDILTIHIDGRPSNRHFITPTLLSLLKPTVIFINTSRGLVLNPAHLADFLRANPAALALLDVHDPEPIPSDYPLLYLPNARLFPHIAARTSTAMENMSWVVRDVLLVLQGKPPDFPAPAFDPF